MFQKYKSVIAYLFWGVVTTIINIGVFMIWIYFGGNYQVGNVVAWILTVLVAYFSNKFWVFGSSYQGLKATISEMLSFFFFRGITLIMDIVITYVGISLLNWDSFLVKVLDNIFVVISNYVFSKLYIFKQK
ncbi:GtcA family membrane protein [Ligilactobacillus pobuzihii E100301 = KCTC 13174]|uniref:GtcA family membrane protein n=2 Tax=Ligilactobacillus pobuzihii TaxID=449659 RepID=A0A0R2LC59_9LACO|nr:GtcA family membrane protein [Ligilactobacillus pobuzihii E100301 = KCTC 13174]KRN99168.1 GtcA family membrane protein [Ligilactobacillus pobuzihii]